MSDRPYDGQYRDELLEEIRDLLQKMLYIMQKPERDNAAMADLFGPFGELFMPKKEPK